MRKQESGPVPGGRTVAKPDPVEPKQSKSSGDRAGKPKNQESDK